jgi:hypothetical protein
MTPLLPLSNSALLAMAEAIFSKSPLAVVESDSFDSAPRRLTTVAEFCDYAAEQKTNPRGSVHLAVLYPDMGGQLTEARRDHAPESSGGISYGVSIEGWGLIRVYLDLRGGRPPGSPELALPSTWNWSAVKSHERRLARALKSVA